MIPSPLKLLIAMLAVALLAFLQCKINLHKKYRYLQKTFVLEAAVYCVVVSLVMFRYREDIVETLLNSSILSLADILALNLCFEIGFLVVKAISCISITGKRKKVQKVDINENEVYSYNEKYSQYFLKNEYVPVRKMFKTFVAFSTIAFGLFLGTTWAAGSKSVVWLYVFPIITQIVLIEIYNYLNGETLDEFNSKIYGDNTYYQKVSNYYRIRQLYEQLFKNTILTAHTAADYTQKSRVTDLINSLDKSSDRVEQITGKYFKINGDPKRLEADGIQATLTMMKKKNVVFFNPFYRDSISYIMFPIVYNLVSSKHVLVIVGRNSIKSDVEQWLKESIKNYNNMDTLWSVKPLGENNPHCEIGLLTASQIHNPTVIEKNREFFNDTGLVIIIEPSLFINTGQIGMTVLADELKMIEEPAFCILDRPTDGIVDTMSHVLQTEFTNVVAPPVARCIHTGVIFDADGDFRRQELFDKETRFLGGGIELAAVAIKNQVPSVAWYGERKTPIRDIKWIAGQQYPAITKYMNLVSQQQSIYESIGFESSLWSAKEEKEQFLIVEDEFCNMYGTLRSFFSRGKDQVFVNVLSENYLLRDYMRYNPDIFLSNANAIPSIVTDYAKTERNIISKLLLAMSARPVKASELKQELRMLGYSDEDYFGTFLEMVNKYATVNETLFKVIDVSDDDKNVIEEAYLISDYDFSKAFAKTLKNAYYIVENESERGHYVDAKMYGHVTQTVLPGQYLTFDGKYYRVNSVSTEGGVVLRRASDQYEGRKYYRQLRTYIIDSINDGETVEVERSYTVQDIEITQLTKDIKVKTTGYLEMSRNDDLRHASRVDFSKDINQVKSFEREYKRKSILKIKMPDANNDVRFTLCIVLSEILKTIFPESWPYLAVTSYNENHSEGMLNHLIYGLDGDVEKEAIYIIEDSDIDMGLIGAVEKNWMKFMEIVADYLAWHFEQMRKTDKIETSVYDIEMPVDVKGKNALAKFFEKLLALLGIKPKMNDSDGNVGEDREESASEDEKPTGETLEETPEEQSEQIEETPEEQSEQIEETPEEQLEQIEEIPEEQPEQIEETSEVEIKVENKENSVEEKQECSTSEEIIPDGEEVGRNENE